MTKPDTGHRIVYTPLDDIKPAERNPKSHDLAAVRASIERFGFVAPGLTDERTGRLVVGHGRLDALRQMRDEGCTPPAGVQVDEHGRWLVPVVSGWASRSDAEAEAYVVADNRHTELGGWDETLLVEVLTSIADVDAELLQAAGYEEEMLHELQASVDDRTQLPLVEPDEVPPPPPEPRSAPGDVWILGEHRVLCGDSTDVVAVEEMLAGERADCMWTDPPYGVNYVGKTQDALTIKNDGEKDLEELLAGAWAVASVALKPGAPFYIAHPQGKNQLIFMNTVLNAGWLYRQTLIWVKESLVLGRSDYHYRHEPIIYGFTAPDGTEGRLGRGGDRWFGDDAQTSVFEVARPARNAEHPTMKPVQLITAMLANSCPPGGLVYEPFGGSGSTLIAAHELGMRARVVELDPTYVDVICRRWQQATGVMPVHAVTGESVDFVS